VKIFNGPSSPTRSTESCQRQKVAFAGPCSLINHPIKGRRADFWGPGCTDSALFAVGQKSKLLPVLVQFTPHNTVTHCRKGN